MPSWAASRVSSGSRQISYFEPGVFTPVRGAETFLEAVYQVQALTSWQVQPDVQYVINPGAGIANPDELCQKVRNEWVLGLRTTLTF